MKTNEKQSIRDSEAIRLLDSQIDERFFEDEPIKTKAPERTRRPKGLKLGWEISEDPEKLKPDEILTGWIQRGELSLLIGGKSCGKSRLINAMAGFGAVDADFIGLHKNQPFKTLYLAPEGQPSIERHRLALIHHFGPDDANAIRRGIHYCDLVDLDSEYALHTPAGYQYIAENIRFLKSKGIRIDVIAADSISLMTGGEQIEPKVIHAALFNLRKAAKDFNCGAIASHHHNRGGKGYEGTGMYERHCVIVRGIKGNSRSIEYKIEDIANRDDATNWKAEYRIEPVSINGNTYKGIATITALTPVKSKAPENRKLHKAETESERRLQQAIDLIAEGMTDESEIRRQIELAAPKDIKPTSRKDYSLRVIKALKKHAQVSYNAESKTFKYNRDSD